MRKIITFLGTKPLETVYEMQEKTYPGRVFAEALREFVRFDKMLVLTTKEAAEKTWPILENLGDPRIERVPIPDGKDTEEMWGIFQAVIEQVNEGETVIFDITHGFRSLPFLAFLFAAYLKTAKKVNIEAIYYGAYDMAAQNDGKAPVIDLSPFAEMLDWITATDQFVRTGNARRLAELLNPQGKKRGMAAEASQTLSAVSMAAFLCQPFELMKTARELEQKLADAQSELELNARPFQVLREQIVGEFGRFGADFQSNEQEALRQEFQLVEWYFENGQLMQALTLAREWLIDAVTFRLDEPLNFAKDPRTTKEWAISGLDRVGRLLVDEQRKGTIDDLNADGKKVWEWPERQLLRDTWNAIQYPRNTLDHAGHQREPLHPKTIQRKAEKEILPNLRKLAEAWELA